MTTPDYFAWDMKDEFTFLQAAFLWLNMEPEHCYLPDLFSKRSKYPPKIGNVALEITKQLGIEVVRHDDPNRRTRLVTRAELVSLAKNKGQRPLFRFKEDRAPSEKPPATRDNTLPNIIGAMLALFLDTSDDGKKLSPFSSQNDIITALLDRYSHKPGISESNLKKHFAAAKKSLDQP